MFHCPKWEIKPVVQCILGIFQAAARRILLETVERLSPKELQTFRWFLEFTCFQRSLPLIPGIQRSWAGSPDALVDLMMKYHGLKSVEVTKDVFMDMKRTDLVQMLSETSSWLKGKRQKNKNNALPNSICLVNMIYNSEKKLLLLFALN